jgi:hypothetical protein
VLKVENAQVQGVYNKDISNTGIIASFTSGERSIPSGGGFERGKQVVPVIPNQQQEKFPPEAIYKLGDKGPGGGIIFYDKGNNSGGWRYLEAAPANTEKALTFFIDGYGMYNSVKCSDKRVGAGKENTLIWMSVIDKEGGGINTAQWYCNQLIVNGYADWYLPTEDELLYMYNLLNNGLGDFQSKEYWASNDTKRTYYYQIFVDFSNGKVGQNFFNKEVKRLVSVPVGNFRAMEIIEQKRFNCKWGLLL